MTELQNTRSFVLDIRLSETNRQSDGQILSELNADVYTVKSQEEALDYLSNHEPDFIFLDDLADDLCSRLKSDRYSKIPVLMWIRSSATEQQLNASQTSGADVLIREPADSFMIAALARMLTRLRAAGKELEAAVSSVQRSRSEIHQFAMRASHDFQASLRAISAFSQLMESEQGSKPEDQKKYLEYIVSGAMQIQSLLSYFLSYTRVGSSETSYGSVLLRSATNAALKDLKQDLTKSNAETKIVGSLPTVKGSLPELQQLMHSLLSNAIKYHKPDSPPIIQISAERSSDREWTISVTDDGIGIGKQHHESIFTPFKRLHGREIPGTGMGLALCRKIVETHGGRIWVESSSDSGATFRFTLPAGDVA